ncbi:MAG: gamma-glutamyl-gamma-aminobutyrate hydrolase family protein [Thiothrix sp.]|uniref:type 1 glutamine amidotransferase n=1 Tax=Thiothrix sp. TaxID=1032 RepID=UPI002634B4BD|nr:gamma-glutamyl-gamma-aminobutyrate hydrolase family protein [Thiothrix sp.]MDD5392094.1 gamma-glutamyl-gamma-aminobutyrate hydrolase family protein [Thiothrix sp.]
MHVHYLQHVPFEGDLGSMKDWLLQRGARISCTQFFANEALPEIESIDLLIVMGGPMSINDEAEFPWLVTEKRYIRTMIAAGKPVLGICLGAQLIASSQGAAVYPNAEKEIGWLPIHAADNLPDHAFRFPAEATVFQWHGETFDLPADAILLASSPACRHQAFQVGNKAIGLQFHLEIIQGSAKDLVENCEHELVEGKPYIQSKAEILGADAAHYRAIHTLAEEVLSFLLA